MADSSAEIAYDAARSAWEYQAQELLSLRARGGTGAVIGIAALLSVLAATLVVLLPHRLVFRVSPIGVLRKYFEVPAPAAVEQTQAHLARVIDRHHAANEAILRRLDRVFQLACLGRVVETIAFLTGL